MFYMYEFILQVSTAVMTNELMSDLHLNAAELGAMTAFYYYAYTPMQLPAGLLYDRFGPRLLLTLAVSVCALGAFLFAATSNVWMASTGRFLMGIGSAFSFIGALLLVSRWFPPHYFALLWARSINELFRRHCRPSLFSLRDSSLGMATHTPWACLDGHLTRSAHVVDCSK